MLDINGDFFEKSMKVSNASPVRKEKETEQCISVPRQKRNSCGDTLHELSVLFVLALFSTTKSSSQ